MIDFNELRKAYEKKVGYTVFMEEGEMLDFYRSVNTIVKPVCGIFSVNPIAMTAIQRPFIGILTVNIEMLAPPDRWEEVSQKMNVVAAELNGTTEHYTGDDGKKYSVSHNCQTSSVDGHILDVSIGCGEVFPIRQTISYIIIESGVSAYDAKLWIDGMEVPILSLAESKIHTTSVYATDNGDGNTASEMESYGIDFTTPYTTDEVCNLFRDAVNNKTGNTAHCVMVEKNGVKSCRIMQFANSSNSISPPQNIGFNISMTEIHPSVADFDSRWIEKRERRKFSSIDLSIINAHEQDVISATVFWGDGNADFYTPMSGTVYHIYADDKDSHIVRVFKNYDFAGFVPFQYIEGATYNLLGKPFKIVTNGKKVTAGSETTVIFSNGKESKDANYRAIVTKGGRFYQVINYTLIPFDRWDEAQGVYYITDSTIPQCALDDVKYVNLDATFEEDGKYYTYFELFYIDRGAIDTHLEV